MRVGIIGAGERGRIAYARELNKYDDVEIVSIVEIGEKRLKLTGEEFNIDEEYLLQMLMIFSKKWTRKNLSML